jgi:hypothetical protein
MSVQFIYWQEGKTFSRNLWSTVKALFLIIKDIKRRKKPSIGWHKSHPVAGKKNIIKIFGKNFSSGRHGQSGHCAQAVNPSGLHGLLASPDLPVRHASSSPFNVHSVSIVGVVLHRPDSQPGSLAPPTRGSGTHNRGSGTHNPGFWQPQHGFLAPPPRGSFTPNPGVWHPQPVGLAPTTCGSGTHNPGVWHPQPGGLAPPTNPWGLAFC